MPKRSARGKLNRGWKATQTHAKIKKKTKLALFTIGLIIILILLGQVINFTKALLNPWQQGALAKNYLWDRQFNINLVVKNESVSVLLFNPIKKEATIIKIPDNTFLDVPQGLGWWQLRSIYDLGGDKLLKNSLSSFLGIPIDGFIKLTGYLEQKRTEDLISEIRQNPLNTIRLLSSIQTDLTLWELLNLNLSLAQIRFDKVKTLDLVKLRVLDEQKLADGTWVFTADPARLDSILSDAVDNKLREEHLSIAVFNATDHPQLAQKVKRLISNLGGNVIQISNAPKKSDKSYLFGEKSQTLKRLTQIFDLGDKINLKDLDEISSRAQINLILGEDFSKKIGN